MNKIIAFVLFSIVTLYGSWTGMTIDEAIKQSDLIVYGVIDSIEVADPVEDPQIILYDIAYIKVKNLLHNSTVFNYKEGFDYIPLRMPSINNKMTASTWGAYRFKNKTKGIWLLVYHNGNFLINHPVRFQEQGRENDILSKIKKFKRSDLEYPQGGFNVRLGMSVPIQSEDSDLGFSWGLTAVGRAYKNISIGINLSMSTWIAEAIIASASLTYTDISGVVRFSSQKLNSNYSFFQVGAGNFSGRMTVDFLGESESETFNDFGLTCSGGLQLGKFLIQPTLKYIFSSEGKDIKWMVLCIGFGV